MDCVSRYFALRELFCDVLFAFTESRLPDISPEESQTCNSIIAACDDEVVSKLSTRTCEERVSDLGEHIDSMVHSRSLAVLIRMVTSGLLKADDRRIAANTENNPGEGSSNADGPSPEVPNHDVEEEDVN
ncbi:hypothetical protein MMC29_005965 [Sticta canariensis]|nr:hypothetical protein [Sticta canariensis]